MTQENQVASFRGTVVNPQPIEVKISVPTPDVSVSRSDRDIAEALPTETVADSLEVRLHFLRPEEGTWVLDVEAFDVIGFASAGMLDDALLGATEWMRDLTSRWEERLAEKDGLSDALIIGAPSKPAIANSYGFTS